MSTLKKEDFDLFEMLCMHCHEEITPDNNGIAINGGEFFQCNDCHYIEFGINIWPSLLWFKPITSGQELTLKS